MKCREICLSDRLILFHSSEVCEYHTLVPSIDGCNMLLIDTPQHASTSLLMWSLRYVVQTGVFIYHSCLCTVITPCPYSVPFTLVYLDQHVPMMKHSCKLWTVL